MDEKTYKITLSDGTILDGLRLNGNNFISETAIVKDVFVGNCSPVVISDGINNEIHENMELVRLSEPVTGEHWFALRDLSPDELDKMKMQSDIEYIAMMSDIEL